MDTDDQDKHERSPESGEPENVIRLPVDWIGPRDSLVPFGPHAPEREPSTDPGDKPEPAVADDGGDGDAAPSDADVLDFRSAPSITQDDFWGGSPESVPRPVIGPPPARAPAPPVAPAGPTPPPATETDAGLPTEIPREPASGGPDVGRGSRVLQLGGRVAAAAAVAAVVAAGANALLDANVASQLHAGKTTSKSSRTRSSAIAVSRATVPHHRLPFEVIVMATKRPASPRPRVRPSRSATSGPTTIAMTGRTAEVRYRPATTGEVVKTAASTSAAVTYPAASTTTSSSAPSTGTSRPTTTTTTPTKTTTTTTPTKTTTTTTQTTAAGPTGPGAPFGPIH